jgi:hypothetical protein
MPTRIGIINDVRTYLSGIRLALRRSGIGERHDATTSSLSTEA